MEELGRELQPWTAQTVQQQAQMDQPCEPGPDQAASRVHSHRLSLHQLLMLRLERDPAAAVDQQRQQLEAAEVRLIVQ